MSTDQLLHFFVSEALATAAQKKLFVPTPRGSHADGGHSADCTQEKNISAHSVRLLEFRTG